jgi:ketosteroid isomerase-like protein
LVDPLQVESGAQSPRIRYSELIHNQAIQLLHKQKQMRFPAAAAMAYSSFCQGNHKMKLRMACAVLVVGVGITACEPNSPAVTVDQRKMIEHQISEQVGLMREAWAGMDAHAVVSFYAEQSRDTFNGDRSTIDAIRSWANEGYSDLAKVEIGVFEDLRIDVLSADAAVASWHNRVTEIAKGDPKATEYVALMTQVWVREGEDWRLLHNHESTRNLRALD